MKLLAMRILKLTCINTITTWFFIFVITHRPTLILFPYTTLFRSHQQATTNQNVKKRPACSELRWAYCNHKATYFASYLTGGTLSQSPMLGFHKQMDNRIKLLEEILSFRMQGVEFDNGDMYVDGHKAASDVRDEFVSVTEKLMDELAQCYNVLPQLDINNTIDHRPEGD